MSTSELPSPPAHRPLQGLKVLEFTHMVMGPACGLVLADLGADVIKVEPLSGDATRQLPGAGAGFFPLFNRGKRSIALDLRQPQGAALARQLALQTDVLIENFKPGTLHKYGLDYASLAAQNPRLIYVGCKGFLPGPYERRTALDEVVQMMGGLAYMTGRPGDPLRAGASVNDIMGGMFGAIGALGALVQRGISGRGQEVQSALFENNVFLMGQHMLQHAITGQPAAPMPERISAWGVYDVFTVAGGRQIFLAVVSDAQWQAFCQALALPELAARADLATNHDRVRQRPVLLPLLRQHLADRDMDALAAQMEAAGLPFAPIRAPHELYDDPHLQATGALTPVTLTDGARAGQQTRAPLLPITLNGQRPGQHAQPPQAGQHTDDILSALGQSPAQIAALRAAHVVA